MRYIVIVEILLNIRPYPNGGEAVWACSGVQKLAALEEKDKINYKKLSKIIGEAEEQVKQDGDHDKILKGKTLKQWFSELREAVKFDMIDLKLEYWKEIWEEICNAAESPFTPFDFYDLHTLFIDLIEELQLSNFESNDNKTFFTSKLNQLIKENSELVKKIPMLSSVVTELGNGSNPYLLVLCKRVMKEFLENSQHFVAVFEYLKHDILSEQPFDVLRKKIYQMSKTLIIELWLFGYSFSLIREIPQKLCDSYRSRGNDEIVTSFPYRTRDENFMIDGTLDLVNLNKAIKNEIDNLDTSKRLDYLLDYMQAQTKQARVIFPVHGLRQFDEFTVGKVTMYSPVKKPFLKNEKQLELFHRDSSNDAGIMDPIMNASAVVEYKHKDIGEVRFSAAAAIERAFDLFRAYYATPAALQVSKEESLACDLEGNLLCSFGGLDRVKRYRFHEYDPSDLFEAQLATLRVADKIVDDENPSDLDRQISLSMRWNRKSLESLSYEDKIVCSWISLENLFSRRSQLSTMMGLSVNKDKIITLITKVVPYILMPTYIQQLCAKAVSVILSCLSPSQITQISGLEDCFQFDTSNNKYTYDRQKLIVALQAVVSKIRSLRFKEELEQIHIFFHDNDYAQKQLDQEIKKCSQDLTTVYRFRNRIVHIAHSESRSLRLVSKMAYQISAQVLHTVLDLHLKDQRRTIEDIILSLYIRSKQCIDLLKQKEGFSVLAYNFLEQDT